jgi:YbgC/YbaW family acyl-CoA thioester hydrolase
MPSFKTKRRVEFAQTDMAGFAHFSEFARWMESAEHELFRAVGLSVSMRINGRHVSWPRRSCSFDFFRPLRFEDVFDISLSIREIGKSSVSWAAEFLREGTIYATGTCTTVCCDIPEDGPVKAISVPTEILEKLAPFQNKETE